MIDESNLSECMHAYAYISHLSMFYHLASILGDDDGNVSGASAICCSTRVWHTYGDADSLHVWFMIVIRLLFRYPSYRKDGVRLCAAAKQLPDVPPE